MIFCGYSFPDADMHVKYLFKRAQTNRGAKGPIRFTVVNHHPGKKLEQKQEEEYHYKRFLRGPVEYSDASFEEFARAPERFYES